MTYKHKSDPAIICTVLDKTANYVIYQFFRNGIKLTGKVSASNFYSKWESVK